MKKNVILKVGVLLLVVSAILYNVSCSKKQTDATQIPDTVKNDLLKHANEPIFTTVMENKKMRSYRIDDDGNEIMQTPSKNSIEVFGKTCGNQPQPSLLGWATTQQAVCKATAKDIVQFYTTIQVQSLFPLAYTNLKENIRTKGIITIYNGNNVIYSKSTLYINQGDINYTGPSGYGGYNNYTVSFLDQNVPISALQQATHVSVTLNYYTTCPLGDSWSATYDITEFNLGNIPSPCAIVSPMWVYGPTSVGDNNGYIASAQVILGTCYFQHLPSNQEIAFYNASGTSLVYDHVQTCVDISYPTSTQLVKGTNYQYTYRNVVKDASGTTTCTGPWLYPMKTIKW